METDYKETSPVRSTTHGQVRGALQKSIYDELYYTFDGIPYAQPPLGELRFKEPQVAQPWNGILDCTEPRDQCLQVNRFTKEIVGSEDCLYLNIAVKKLKSEKPLPVMVYVHGGYFTVGDPTRRALSPEYLMREDVIYISIGFRLGVFGFLSFADPELGIPGNAGLKDIVLALKWIRANVGNFNGDENNITLFGHSSGSMATQLLSVVPQTEGLFHKMILLSGFMHEMNRLPNIEFRLAQKLGYQGNNIDADLYSLINNADPHLLVSTNILTEVEKSNGTLSTTCSPTIEPYETPTGLIYAEPRELQRKAWSNRIPMILGINSNDGTSPSVEYLEVYKQYPEYLLPHTLLFHRDPEIRRNMGKNVVKSICKVDITELDEESLKRFKTGKTRFMMHQQERLTSARLAYSTADTYLYRFDFDSPDFNFYRLRDMGPGTRGVVHADELGYIFKIPATFKLDKTRAEYSTICRMAAMLAEFALQSNPNVRITHTLGNWEPISQEGPILCLNISESMDFMPLPYQDMLGFMDKLFEEAGVDLI